MRDEWFIRGRVPMTKSEVRAVSLSKLELKPDSVLWDVGAGTGSVSVEASRLLSTGQVFAVEKEEDALELIRKNREKFQADRVTVVPGTAPDAFEGLAVPTHAFIGGSAGKMGPILDALLEKNPGIRVVINVISLESLGEVLSYMKKRDLSGEIVSVQTARSRTAGSHHLMMGQNPVYIISFGGEECPWAEESS